MLTQLSIAPPGDAKTRLNHTFDTFWMPIVLQAIAVEVQHKLCRVASDGDGALARDELSFAALLQPLAIHEGPCWSRLVSDAKNRRASKVRRRQGGSLLVLMPLQTAEAAIYDR